jgi:hypothetical protein
MAPPPLTLPDPSLAQTNPELKKKTVLKYPEPNFSPVSSDVVFLSACVMILIILQLKDEVRARHPKYYFAKGVIVSAREAKTDGALAQDAPEAGVVAVAPEEARGKKRARAEDFL